jgi:hypothetical protein
VRSAHPVRAFPTRYSRGFNGHGGGRHQGYGRR